MTTAMTIPGLNIVKASEMKINDDLLKELSGQVETGVDHQVSLPNMIIFHSTVYNDSIHPEGSFVVGMSKYTEGAEKGKIQEQGKRVLAFTILAQRKQYNYYNEKDKNNICESNFFVDFKEVITGHKHSHTCGKKGACPFIKMEKDGCKCQMVLLGKAHCEDGSVVNARFYAKGAAFMATSELMQSGFKVPTSDGVKNLECFMAPVILGSDGPHVHGTTKYYKPVYKIIGAHPTDQWPALMDDAKVAVEYFKMSDEHKASKKEEGSNVKTPNTITPQQYAPKTQQHPIDGGIDPVAAAQAALLAAQEAAQEQLTVAQAAADAAMNAAAGQAMPINTANNSISMEDKLKAIMAGKQA